MKHLHTFENFTNSPNEELNEIFGLGNLIKSFFKSLSEPMKKQVSIITKNIDSKTGQIKNAKELSNDLLKTFKMIADDKKADLKGVDTEEDVKKILKEFIMEIKTVFSAARVPFGAIISESEQIDEAQSRGLSKDQADAKFRKLWDICRGGECQPQRSQGADGKWYVSFHAASSKVKAEAMRVLRESDSEETTSLNEDLKADFKMVMTKTSPEEFEDYLDEFLNDWVKSIDGSYKDLEKAATKMIDTMMKTFETKLKAFGPARLQSLISLTQKNANPSKEEIKKVLSEPAEKDNEEKEVKTPEGKDQFIKAIQDSQKDLEFVKIPQGDGTYNLVVKGIKL